MREIKFRFYYQNNKTGEWRKYEQTLDEIIDQDSWQGVRIFVFKATCQYTGLKDKNGKDIYEGDILANHSYSIGGKPDKGVVEFGSHSDAEYYREHVGWYMNGRSFYGDEVEVIGNVFEHPHLLKQ